MKKIATSTLFILLFIFNGYSQTNIIVNGSFENDPFYITPWVGSTKFGNFGASPCAGSRFLLTADGAGLAYTYLTNEYVYQNVTIPANATAATLNFCYKINTDNASSGVSMQVWFGASAIATYYYANSNNSWVSASLPISNISSYLGQTLAIQFYANESSTNSYWGKVYVDDVTLMVTTPSCTPVTNGATQPQNQTQTAGNTATFSVSANGTPPYSYFWYKNGSPTGVSTLNTFNSTDYYTTPTLNYPSDNGSTYYCFITNCNNTQQVQSNTATLTVTSGCSGVSITNSLSNQNTTVGNTATWSVSVTGTSPFTYQWYKNGSQIAGATNASYTTPTLTLGDNGSQYYCYITNCSGSNNATSNTAILSVSSGCTGVSITNTLSNQNATVGNTVSWTVNTSGTAPFTYQWYKNGSQISGATNSTYITSTLTLGDNGSQYYCYVTNCSGSNNATSNSATLNVSSGCTGVSISNTLANQNAIVGGTATWTVNTNGTAPFTFQWYKNGSQISGATNSTFITPTLTLGDNGSQYYCYVTNCSGSNNATSNTATLSVSGTPSNLTISNVVHNNSTFPLPRILWSGTTTQSASTIKICADASKATEITFINNTGIPTTNIRFWIGSDTLGVNSDMSGYFVFTDYQFNGITVTAKLTHPKYLQSSYAPFRTDNIRVVDYTNSYPSIFLIPIQIYRAPVIMVHGLWGGITTFETMEDSLDNSGYYPDELTTRVNYFSSNGAYFYDNRFVLPTEINSLFALIRTYGYSAGKVDVVAHSMGGLISRYYLQSTAYQQKEDIHKLITINSPHSGSPCGNLLINPTSNVSAAARPVAELIAQQYFNSSIYNGAIGDLAINSFAMNYLNFSTLNNGVVPSHTIITETQVGNDNLWYLILSAAAPVVPMTINSFLNYLYFAESNDLVVSSSSQSGGLTPNNTTMFPNQFHIGSSANPFVITEVKNALNINSANTNYFSNSGFAPIANSSHYKIQSQQQSSSHILTGSISINYPVAGQSFNQGDIIPFNITSLNGISRIILEGINLENNSDLVDTTMSNGTINYLVPNNGMGVMKFIALGYDTMGLIDYDTVSININQTANITGLSSYNDTIYVQVNNFASISIKASFSNGFNYPLNLFSGVLYQVADTNLAVYHSQNLIKGKSLGITNLSISYMGQNLNIPIVIIPQDTTIIITTSIAQESKGNTNNDSFIVFPNPTNEFINIKGKKLTDNLYSFSISNSIGQSIHKQSLKTVGESFETKIDLKNLPKGIYFLQISSDKTKKAFKVVKN